MAYSQDIRNEKVKFTSYTTNSSGLSPEIDLQGGTLNTVLLEADITSTSFTILVSRVSGGTYVTAKDALGIYGTKGAAISFGLDTTATGDYFIPPSVTAGYRFCKIQLGSSEAITLYISRRNFQ